MKSTTDLIKTIQNENDITQKLCSRTWIMELYNRLIKNSTILPCGATKYFSNKEPLLDANLLCLTNPLNLIPKDKTKPPHIHIWREPNEYKRNIFMVQISGKIASKVNLNTNPAPLPFELNIKNGNSIIIIFNGKTKNVSSFKMIELGYLDRQSNTVAHIIGRLVIYNELSKEQLNKILIKHSKRILYIIKKNQKRTKYMVIIAHIPIKKRAINV